MEYLHVGPLRLATAQYAPVEVGVQGHTVAGVGAVTLPMPDAVGEERHRALGHLDQHACVVALAGARMAPHLGAAGTIQVGPDARVQSSSARTLTSVSANSG